MAINLKFTIGKHDSDQDISQNVSYFYTYENKSATSGDFPGKKEYTELVSSKNTLIAAFNYKEESSVIDYSIYRATGIVNQASKGWTTSSVYKREIWEDGGESIYHPVVEDATSLYLSDYNIANNRIYEYVIYPNSTEAEQPKEIKAVVTTRWDFWSVTELHPTTDKKIYTASASDVWIFKFNVEPSEQTQNISKTQQDNLSAYPRFSHGKKNNISSSVTAYLGSEMTNWNWVTTKSVPYIKTVTVKGVEKEELAWKTETFSGKNDGGYKETVPFARRLSSNEKIDMLNLWRKVCYSGNPKLLKDMKGQEFLIQITECSNQPNYTYQRMPDTVSFSWVEIGNVDDIMVYGER